jgi:hypothetical protein
MAIISLRLERSGAKHGLIACGGAATSAYLWRADSGGRCPSPHLGLAHVSVNLQNF